MQVDINANVIIINADATRLPHFFCSVCFNVTICVRAFRDQIGDDDGDDDDDGGETEY